MEGGRRAGGGGVERPIGGWRVGVAELGAQ